MFVGLKRVLVRRILKLLVLFIILFLPVSRILYRNLNKMQLEEYKIKFSRQIIDTLGSRNVSQFLNVIEDTTHLSPILNNDRDSIYTVVIVMTKAENSDWRRTIRETWAGWARETESIVLFYISSIDLSDDLKQESQLYDDLIVDNFSNDVLLSSVQTLRMLNWYQRNFGEKSQFLIKTDDKMFLNLHIIRKHLDELKENDIFNGYIAGKVYNDDQSRTPDFDDPHSPRFVPHDLWDGGIYPEFISPSFLLISQRVVPYLLEVCGNIPLFHIEHFYLTGMLVRWTLRLDLTEFPDVYDEYSLSLDYDLWWNGGYKNATAFQCNNRWRMMNMFRRLS